MQQNVSLGVCLILGQNMKDMGCVTKIERLPTSFINGH